MRSASTVVCAACSLGVVASFKAEADPCVSGALTLVGDTRTGGEDTRPACVVVVVVEPPPFGARTPTAAEVPAPPPNRQEEVEMRSLPCTSATRRTIRELSPPSLPADREREKSSPPPTRGSAGAAANAILRVIGFPGRSAGSMALALSQFYLACL
eukprot:m.159776 g.159776  ORF g.159776 m.159776 type:complete len:156 (+) comp15184_c8_seq1:867-1334(+)